MYHVHCKLLDKGLSTLSKIDYQELGQFSEIYIIFVKTMRFCNKHNTFCMYILQNISD